MRSDPQRRKTSLTTHRPEPTAQAAHAGRTTVGWAGALIALFVAVGVSAHDGGGGGSSSVCANEGPFGVPGLQSPASQIGQWGPVENWPIQATHSVVLHTGKVLVWRRGDPPYLWNPADHSLTPAAIPSHGDDMFCAGHSTMADGRVIVASGTVNRLNKFGSKEVHAFDPVSETWTQLANLHIGRWYPTLTTLGNGQIIAMSGDITPTERAKDPEVYDPDTNTWTRLNTATKLVENYPFNFVLPDGRYFYSGGRGGQSYSSALDLQTRKWTRIARVNHPGGGGASGSAAMYAPGKIVKIGGRVGNNNNLEGVEVIDMNAANPAWRAVAPMNFFRRRADIILLPTNKSLIVGGSVAGQSSHECAVHATEVWDPISETFTQAASHAKPRIYHSTSVLLPDGRVLAAGSENHDGPEENAEVYSPAYLFQGQRPTVTSAPASVAYGETFTVTSPDAVDIGSVALMRPSAATHNFDQNQRFMQLPFTVSGSNLQINAPANGNLAPPGYYMLFLVNSAGVPAVAKWIQVLDNGGGGNQLPNVSIASPVNNTTVISGDSVTFSASANDVEDGNLSASIVWTSNLDGVLGTGAFSRSDLSAGTHFISANVTDSAGGAATDNRFLHVNLTGGGEFVTLPVAADAHTRFKAPAINHGGLDYLTVRARQGGFMDFELGATGGAPIASAILNVHIDSVPTPGTINVSRVLGPWTELGITHDSRPSHAMPVVNQALNSNDSGLLQLDITPIVQQWLADPLAAFGLVFTDADGLVVRLDSRESANPAFIEVSTIAQPTLSIAVPSPASPIFSGTVVTFSATATDFDGSDLGADVAWTSDLDGPLGNGATLTTNSLTEGIHQITATVTNDSGQAATANRTFEVQSDTATVFNFVLDASQVVPASTAAGTAQAQVSINAARTELTYTLTFDENLRLSADVHNATDDADVVGVHIHAGTVGANGPHVLNVFGLPSEDDAQMTVDFSSNSLSGVWDDGDEAGDPASPGSSKKLSAFIDAALNGGLYFGIHTKGANGGLAVRGQIVDGPVTQPEQVIAPATADAFVRRSAAHTNISSLDYVRVNGSRTPYLQFDTAGLTGNISSAILHLHVDDVYRAGVAVFSYVLAPWQEATITYANKPPINAISSATASVIKANQGTFLHVDITPLVQQWINNPASNWGLAITPELALNATFRTTESGAATAPFVEVVY